MEVTNDVLIRREGDGGVGFFIRLTVCLPGSHCSQTIYIIGSFVVLPDSICPLLHIERAERK